jgi:hypothetical protein
MLACEFGGSEHRWQLDQCQGISASLGDQLFHYGGRKRRRTAAHQRDCVVFGKAMDLVLREAGRGEAVSLALPGGEQQRDSLRLQTTRNKEQGVGGRLVQPVRVVDEADEPCVRGKVNIRVRAETATRNRSGTG